jgi:2-keto-4-pentenoate hydratase/2-oxohepta-3-ene-1,7-dioic acid hydratase in catechol pathway
VKLATYEYQGKVGVGVVQGDAVARVESVPDMLALIEQGATGLKVARESIPLRQVKLLAPIPHPRKNIFALGRNYAEHAKESAAARGEKIGPPVVSRKRRQRSTRRSAKS